jgi:F-type H+-transporting ATPase subunit delta
MASRASARRYARALFDVVAKAGDPSAALAELQAQLALLESYPELRKAFLGVGIPLAAKLSVMRDVLQLQTVSPVVSRLLLLMVEHDDIDEIAQVVADFERRVLDFHHVVRVEVTTAVPLGPDREAALVGALAQLTGGQVRLDAQINPGIIGGIVAKAGSRVFDGSVTRHLERMRARLVAGQAL